MNHNCQMKLFTVLKEGKFPHILHSDLYGFVCRNEDHRRQRDRTCTVNVVYVDKDKFWTLPFSRQMHIERIEKDFGVWAWNNPIDAKNTIRNLCGFDPVE